MTFIDAVSAMFVLVVFLGGFSPALLPVWRAWEKAEVEYRTGRTINFIAESFKGECAKPERDIENWKKIIKTAIELESLEIIEMMEGEDLWALKVRCFIGGEYIEIIGLCTPGEKTKGGVNETKALLFNCLHDHRVFGCFMQNR